MEQLSIEGIRPNPFNPSTTISFAAPAGVPTTVTIYDALGRQVELLYEGNSSGVRQELTWKAEGRASGIYFVRVISGGESLSAKMILVK